MKSAAERDRLAKSDSVWRSAAAELERQNQDLRDLVGELCKQLDTAILLIEGEPGRDRTIVLKPGSLLYEGKAILARAKALGVPCR